MDDDLEEMLRTDFTGGTFVEYKMGTRFEQEFMRTPIKEVIIEDSTLSIKSPSNQSMFTRNYKQINFMKKEDGVFYFICPRGAYHAMAPKDVEIPLKETYEFK